VIAPVTGGFAMPKPDTPYVIRSYAGPLKDQAERPHCDFSLKITEPASGSLKQPAAFTRGLTHGDC